MPLAICPALLPPGLYSAPALAVQQSRPTIALPQAPALAYAQPWSSREAPQPLQPPTAAAAAAAAAPLGLPPAAAQLVIPAAKEKEPLMDTLRRAGHKALGGGVPGAAAMAVQVRPAPLGAARCRLNRRGGPGRPPSAVRRCLVQPPGAGALAAACPRPCCPAAPLVRWDAAADACSCLHLPHAAGAVAHVAPHNRQLPVSGHCRDAGLLSACGRGRLARPVSCARRGGPPTCSVRSLPAGTDMAS